MGCGGDREKQEFLRVEQKWDYVNLDDFKSSSWLTPIAYGYLIIMLIVSVSVYAVDTFTCINLLVFDKWSGQIQPKISFKIARWIFTGCILLSFVLLAYRWLRAIRVMRQGGVAKSYLDPLAIRIQSIRPGSTGRGWRRFLVFAELTKSRKGADYVALFSYYSFESWLRVVFAEGPRQVVNALTLYAVLRADLIPEGDNGPAAGVSPFVQFWLNVARLAKTDNLQATILVGMLWTLIIWVISFLSLVVSVILYLIFLWHHIPPQDGSLTVYCRKKINRRMERVVKTKVDTALKKENELRARQEAQAHREGRPDLRKEPTLPNITVDTKSLAPMSRQNTMPDLKKEPTLPNIAIDTNSLPPLSRQNTMTTLPEYQSRPGSARNSDEDVPPMPSYHREPTSMLQRHGTQASDASWASYNSNAPLMASAGDMGYSQRYADELQTPATAMSTPWSARPTPYRGTTESSHYYDRPYTPGGRPPTSQSNWGGPESYQMEPVPRSGTAMSNRSIPRRHGSGSESQSAYRGQTPMRQIPNGPGANGSYFPPIPESDRSSPATEPPRSYTPYGAPARSHTPQQPPSRSHTPQVSSDRPRTPHDPMPSQSFPSDVQRSPTKASTPMDPPPRSNTAPLPSSARSFTPVNQIPRAYTPQNPPPDRSFESSAPPYEPVRAHASSNISNSGYVAFNPRSEALASEPVQQQQYRSYSRPLGPDQHYDEANRDSGFDDILDHY